MEWKAPVAWFLMAVLVRPTLAEEPNALPDTKPLLLQGDLSAQMVAGIDRYLMRELDESVAARARFWQRDFTSSAAYERSVEPNRQRLRTILGAVDRRVPVTKLEFVADTTHPAQLAETGNFTIHAVRWPVFAGVYAEGLWLRPKGAVVARIVVLPDADQTPEMLAGLTPDLPVDQQTARRLAENSCELLVPVLISRDDARSGNAPLKRFTNQPHREWIYRQAYELGRHIIGYEVQKVQAAVDWFEQQNGRRSGDRTATPRIGVLGFGEGGLIALYSAALDPRIEATLVGGYFNSRQQIWEEPIYRNVFGLLREFGDAEVATLIAPRALIIEPSKAPQVDGPPPRRQGRSGAAPGRLSTPELSSVEKEFNRARELLAAGNSPAFGRLELIPDAGGDVVSPGSQRALIAWLRSLGVAVEKLPVSATSPADRRGNFDPAERQERQVAQLEEFTQGLLRAAERTRADFFWKTIKAASPEEWEKATELFRRKFWEDTLGRVPAASLPANPRSRKLEEQAKWTAYEVVLEVHPDVFAWGTLLVPKDLKTSERRPTVVCQHGLEGVPADVINPDPSSEAYRYYKAFAARLADRGFVVFAPHNPYRGGDAFRVLQRKANPLGKSLFSVIIAQHERILDWLAEQPFVDPRRIGFYGLSYGGKTAMRVPAVLPRYALSICSADFNEWVHKNVSVDYSASYMFTGEYEMPEWNLGHTFNYAEMAALIAPRPFMVERGHDDGVGVDEWVAYEYARVRRLYARLGIPGRTAIEFFDGLHTINGVGTFRFLDEHLTNLPP